MDIEFLKEVLSIPNPSYSEDFLSETIQNWCGANRINVKKDGKGNLFLTKGNAKVYPCFTSHLDSVLRGADAEKAVKEKKQLEIVQNGDRLTAKLNGKQCVIGCDCKNGIAIILSCMQQLRAAKAAFYVQEEVGCRGVQGSDMNFFSDCSFVIGLDSPEFNRAAKSCLGLPLFSEKFFKEQLEPICKKHGLTNFKAEPGTDIFFIRKDANNNAADKESRIECINFGNGGYNEHSDQEYASIRDVNKSEALALDLAKSIEQKAWFSTPPPPPPPPKWHQPPSVQPGFRFEPFRPSGSIKSFWSGEEEKRHERGKKYTIPLDKYVGVSFTFSDAERYDKFVNGPVLDLGIDLDEDEDEKMVTVSGMLKDVKTAYVIAFNVEENTNYKTFNEFRISEDDDDFWDNLYVPGEGDDRQMTFDFGDDMPPPDDVFDVDVDIDVEDPDDKIDPGDALDDFWDRMKKH